MSRSKRLLLLILLPALTGTGCRVVKMNFSEELLVHTAFYNAVLAGTCSKDTSIKIYKTSFRDRYVVAGNVQAVVSLNDETARDTVADMPPPEGYRQDLYLAHLRASLCTDTWIYLSAWYRPGQDSAYAFGAAYSGFADAGGKDIYFTRRLRVKNGESGCTLQESGKVNFHFVLAATDNELVSVSRIVQMEDNKLGGTDAFIFRVADHFPGDLTAINFRRIRP